MSLLPDLFGQFPQPGRVEWIGVRPQREGRLVSVREVRAIAGAGLQGDHYAGGANGKRHLTLIQHEHLAVVARLLALRDNTPTVLPVDPALVRRNVVISGLNLLALKNKRFRLGATLLEFTEPCQPCSAHGMSRGWSARGTNKALRGHGGICARILEGGPIRIGDELVALDAPS
ncbi:MAG: MOSC domain-containing protein [Betaproteobacteria bacterium]|nr:MOSC domain-containing protein [Betaproteobacteria bacterium]